MDRLILEMIVKLSPNRFRLKAGGLHLVVSLCLALALAWPAYAIWFPGDYSTLSGGNHLFLLIMAVDVILGPFMTVLLAAPVKRRRVLIADLAIVFALQVCALAYGVKTLIEARPIALVFEFDRFVVISAVEVPSDAMSDAPSGLIGSTWFGPKILATRRPSTLAEHLYEIDSSIGGVSLAGLPRFWIPYMNASSEAWNKALELGSSIELQAAQRRKVEGLAASQGVRLEEVRVIPLSSRHASGFVVLAGENGSVVGVVGPAE